MEIKISFFLFVSVSAFVSVSVSVSVSLFVFGPIFVSIFVSIFESVSVFVSESDTDDADDNLGVAGKVGGNQRVQHPHSRTSFCISANFFLPNNFPQIAFNLITPFQPQQSLECKSQKKLN